MNTVSDNMFEYLTIEEKDDFFALKKSCKEDKQVDELCHLINAPVPNINQIVSKAFHYFFYKNLDKHSSSLPHAIDNIKKLNQALQDMFSSKKSISGSTEKIILPYLKMMPKNDPKDLFYMLQKTPFLDTIIEKNNTNLLKYVLEQYKGKTDYLNAYLQSPRFGSDNNDDNNMRFRFFFESPTFNNLMLKVIPASFFINSGVPLGLSINAKIHESTQKGLTSIQKKYLQQLSSKAEHAFFQVIAICLQKDLVPSHKLPDVLPLLEMALSSEHAGYQAMFRDLLLSKKYARFKTGHTSFFEALLSLPLTPMQQKPIFYAACSTDEGYDMVLQATVKTKENASKNFLWHLLDEGVVSYSDVYAIQVVERALRDRVDSFVFAPKSKFPSSDTDIFKLFQGYFIDQPMQAIHFLNTFSDIRQHPTTYWDDMMRFVSLPAAQLKLFSQYRIMHHWAQLGYYEKIQDFFKEHNVQPKIRESFWRQKDSQGRTPWHIVCANHHKEFLKKMTPSMRITFMEQLHQADNSGKTLLDLIYSNTKMTKMAIQLIPELKNSFTKAGYRIDTIKVTEQIKPAVIIPEPVQVTSLPKVSWEIKYLGRDKELKNPDYIRLIESEVNHFPAPNTAALRERKSREMKAESYAIPAFKTMYLGKSWRIPYVTHGNVFYVFPGRDRDHAYDDGWSNHIKKLTREFKQQINAKLCVSKHAKLKNKKEIIIAKGNPLTHT